MCEKCKQDDHSWCDRIMKTRGHCTCLNGVCSNLSSEIYTSRGESW